MRLSITSVTNHGMIVCKRVVYAHVLEKAPDVCLEETFDLLEVEFRVYEDSSNIGFDDVGKALKLSEHTISSHTFDTWIYTLGGFSTAVQ